MGEQKPASIVLPFHDPAGLLSPFLQTITPDLKSLFENAFISVSPATQNHQADFIRSLQNDPFFVANFNPPDSLAGDHYRSGYWNAVEKSPSGCILHLCDVDKVANVLMGHHREVFFADLGWANRQEQPVLFQRSPAAWQTYPENYRACEHLVIRAGELLFHRYLDFAWSYLVIPAGRLERVLPQVKSHDFGVLIELVLLLENQLKTKDMDWLAWEDPFILGKDSQPLREERGNSSEETVKRLRGAIQLLPHLLEKMNAV